MGHVYVCKYLQHRGDCDAETEDPVPQSGSQTARGLLRALVSSKNRSSFWTCFWVSRSVGLENVALGLSALGPVVMFPIVGGWRFFLG
jgi:hypothetical protein